MHKTGELWQEYDARGVRVLNGGLPAHTKTNNFYAGIAIMLYRFKDGNVEFLWQKRSKFVDHNAEKWDTSAGGHINYEEPILDAVVRETREEIGAEVDIEKVEFAAKYRVGPDMVIYLYFYDFTGRDEDFNFDDKEVEEVKWVKYEDCEKFAVEVPIKESLWESKAFRLFLEEWQERIRKKYGNL